MARLFQVKRGPKSTIPTLEQGEFGFVTDRDNEQLFIGTGSKNVQFARYDEVEAFAQIVMTELDGKQAALTFDSTPTSGSSNPVTSGGVAQYVNSIAGGGGIFVATHGVTTSAELEAAYNAKKLVVCVYDNGVYTMTTRHSATRHSFDSPFRNTIWSITVENDIWREDVEYSLAMKDHDHRFDDNPTGGSANDTVSFWVEKGPGYCWISETNQVVNQPTQYGFLISYVNEGDAFQIFRDQTDGVTYYRSGDYINGWFQHWVRVVTTDDNDNITVNGVTAKVVEVGNENSAMGMYTNGIGARGDTVWIDASGEAWFKEINIGTNGDYKKVATIDDIKPEITAIDFGNWDTGSFTVVVNGESITGSVAFDSNNCPTSITFNDRTLSITFPN